jgi:hypothetical protein
MGSNLVRVSAAKLTLVVTIVIALLGGYAWLWSQRPIVDCHLAGQGGSPLQSSYDSRFGPITVYLGVDNRGSIDASINLIVTVTNANITESNPSWAECNGTEMTMGLAVQSHSATGYCSVSIVPIGNTENFTISYSMVDTHNWGIPNGLIDHIGGIELNAYPPITVAYNETSEGVYQLVK